METTIAFGAHEACARLAIHAAHSCATLHYEQSNTFEADIQERSDCCPCRQRRAPAFVANSGRDQEDISLNFNGL